MADIGEVLHDLAERVFREAVLLHHLAAELATRGDPKLAREVGRGWQSGTALGQRLTHVAINLELHDGAAELAAGRAAFAKLVELERRAHQDLGS